MRAYTDDETTKKELIRAKAKVKTAKREQLWVNGRLGLIIDGTAKNVEKVKKIDEAEFTNFFASLTTLQVISLYEHWIKEMDKDIDFDSEDEQIAAIRDHIVMQSSEFFKTFPNTEMELSLVLQIYIAQGDLDALERFYNENKDNEDKIKLLRDAFDNSGELLLVLLRKKKFGNLYKKITGRNV